MEGERGLAQHAQREDNHYLARIAPEAGTGKTGALEQDLEATDPRRKSRSSSLLKYAISVLAAITTVFASGSGFTSTLADGDLRVGLELGRCHLKQRQSKWINVFVQEAA